MAKAFNKLVMNGVFAVEKPSGISSAACLSQIQRKFTDSQLFAADLASTLNTRLDNYNKAGGKGSRRKLKNIKVKMGHGGTLDPLASGVLVIGVGDGTKRLQDYLTGGVKVYETEALLGASSTTGDSEGEVLTKTESSHVTKEMCLETAEKFVGDLTQTPPIFSALKMNGMPLYEYARKGLPLPQKIKERDVKVHFITVCDDTLATDHDYDFIQSVVDEDGVPLDKKLSSNPTLNDDKLYFSKQYMVKAEEEGKSTTVDPPKLLSEEAEALPKSYRAPKLHFISKVSSGTYIRSLISDFGKALSSSAYMVKLIRLEQAEWKLGKNVFKYEDFANDEKVWGPVLQKVLKEGSDIDISAEIDFAKKAFHQSADSDDIANKKRERDEEVEGKQETGTEEPSTNKRKLESQKIVN